MVSIVDTLPYPEAEIVYDNMSTDKKVGFTEHDHKYHLIGDPDFKFVSATGIVKRVSNDVDYKEVAKRVVKVKSSKYYGKDAGELIQEWDDNGKFYAGLGTLCHTLGEKCFNKEDTTKIEAILMETEYADRIPHIKAAVKQLFNDGYSVVKTEALLYSVKLQLAGQSDVILKRTLPCGTEHYCIFDWKFLKTGLEKKGKFSFTTRKYTKMKNKFKHLGDCNWMHYSVQLAIYQTLTGDPGSIKEKVLMIVTSDGYEFVPCYPMRIYWNKDLVMHTVYPDFRGMWYVSEENAFYKDAPDIAGLV